MSNSPGPQTPSGRSAQQKAAPAIGIAFLAIRILGSIPGITLNYSEMSFASHNSDALLLGACGSPRIVEDFP